MSGLEYARLREEEGADQAGGEALHHDDATGMDSCDKLDNHTRELKGVPERLSKDLNEEHNEGFSSLQRLDRQDFQQLDFESPPSLPLHRRMGTLLKVLAYILCGVLIGFVFSVWLPSWKAGAKTSRNCAATSDWNGWQSIKYAYIFGDSWTDTAFDPKGTQPSPEAPLGNPDFPGRNAANATNWVGFLTTQYNASLLQTYNLASSGATLDNDVVPGYPMSVALQVYQRFMPHYADAHSPPWKASDTLFIMFAGIVDSIMMNGRKDSDDLSNINGNLTRVYSKLLDSLCGAGARNFLLLNVPPMERTWQPEDIGQEIKDKFKSDVAVYNERVRKAAKELNKFEGTNVWLFDTNTLFNQALDNPTSFAQTSGILNTTTPCGNYASGTPTTDYYDPVCDIPVNQYFWLNGLHPTYPIHDVLAEQLVKLLEKGPNTC